MVDQAASLQELEHRDRRELCLGFLQYVIIPTQILALFWEALSFDRANWDMLFRIYWFPFWIGCIVWLRKRPNDTRAPYFVIGSAVLFLGLVVGMQAASKEAFLSSSWQVYIEIAFPLLAAPISLSLFACLITFVAGAAFYVNYNYFEFSNQSAFLANNLLIVFDVFLLTCVFLVVRKIRNRMYEARIALNSELLKREEQIRIKTEELTRVRVQATLGEAAQMLAHDVRKPFSMLSVIIKTVLDSAQNKEDKEMLEMSLLEVQQSTASVEGMLADVLEIGRNKEPHFEKTSAESLVEFSLSQLFRVNPKSVVQIEYDFQHNCALSCDALRVSRVFGNILSNALQAMNGKGKIWIKTRPDGKMVLFSVGNEGNSIPEDKISHLFDPFFTSGKAGGTGLGLAIAKKIVEAHGGTIGCQNLPGVGVEFWFTLPKAEGIMPNRHTVLPTHSSGFARGISGSSTQSASKEGTDGFESSENNSEMERQLAQLCKERGKSLNFLILEDEAIYRNFMTTM
jgi:signal transduction histidine kinase